MAPGNDLVTGSTVGPFIDTAYDVPFGLRGRVYLSVETIEEMARVAGLFDSPDKKTKALIEAAYGRGHDNAVRESLGGDLRNIHDRLAVVADWLGSLATVVEPAPDQAVIGTIEPATPDPKPVVELSTARATRSSGQGNGASRNRRPAGVSVSTGDEPGFRI